MTAEDQLHSRAIEHLMCAFVLDLNALGQELGLRAQKLLSYLSDVVARFAPFVVRDSMYVAIASEGRALTRMISSVLDRHVPGRRTLFACVLSD